MSKKSYFNLAEDLILTDSLLLSSEMKANYERQYMVNTKGKFMTHVNEIYLREEVSCG